MLVSADATRLQHRPPMESDPEDLRAISNLALGLAQMQLKHGTRTKAQALVRVRKGKGRKLKTSTIRTSGRSLWAETQARLIAKRYHLMWATARHLGRKRIINNVCEHFGVKERTVSNAIRQHPETE